MSLETLLAPLGAAAPGGEDLSFSPEFDAIQDMRREDDPTLEQGEWKTDLKVADWPGVTRLCETLLSQRTKDLRLAGWWAEAATRQRGLAGLRDGLLLVDGLVRNHWDSVHPQADDGDMEQRVGNLSWLLTRVGELAASAPVVTLGRRRLGLRDVDAARARAAKGAAGAPEGGTDAPPTIEAIQRAVAAAGTAAFQALQADADAARTALASLQEAVDARLGADGPAFAPARKALEDTIDRLARLGRDCGLAVADGAATAGSPSDEAAPGASEGGPAAARAPGAAAGPLQTRAQALQQLREVAAFFRRTEPHSPVAYLADKAARWGDMPLHAWLRAVVKDGASLTQLEELLGVDPPPAPPEG